MALTRSVTSIVWGCVVYFTKWLLFLLRLQTEIVKLNELDWLNEAPIAKLSFAGEADEVEEVVVQYEGRVSQNTGVAGGAGERYALRLCGSQQDVVVRSPLEHSLSKHILAAEVKDTSKYLLCPMPGSLISCSECPCSILVIE